MAALSLNMKHGVHVTAVAHMCLILLVVLLNRAIVVRATTCSAVKLLGPHIAAQEERIGIVFQKISDDQNGKPVFAYNLQNGLRDYLFCYQHSPYYSYWAISRKFNNPYESTLQQKDQWDKHCTDHPVDDKKLWQISTDNGLITYPDISVVCVQAPDYSTQTCVTVKIVGASIGPQNTRIGVPYQKEGHNQGKPGTKGLPYFRNTNEDYMYPCTSGNYSRWCVGPELDGSNYQMYAGSNVPHPAEVKGTWFVLDGTSNFRPYLNVSVKCVGETETVIVPKETKVPTKTTTNTPDRPIESTQRVSPNTESVAKDVDDHPPKDKQGVESDKPSSNTALIIGVAAAVLVVVIALFVVFFLVIWKRLQKNNIHTGNPGVMYTPEAPSRRNTSVAPKSMSNTPDYIEPSQDYEVCTDYEPKGYTYPNVVETTAPNREPLYEQLEKEDYK